MPLLYMKEIMTPLKLLGIAFFKCTDRHLYIKIGNKHRKRLFWFPLINWSEDFLWCFSSYWYIRIKVLFMFSPLLPIVEGGIVVFWSSVVPVHIRITDEPVAFKGCLLLGGMKNKERQNRQKAMTQSYRGLCQKQSLPAAIKKRERKDLMSNYYGITPEEIFKKKKRKKGILLAMIFLMIILISASATFLINQM